MLDAQQRIDPGRIGREELFELDDRPRRLCADFEQIGHLRFAEAPGEMHDEPRILAPTLDVAEHVDATARCDPAGWTLAAMMLAARSSLGRGGSNAVLYPSGETPNCRSVDQAAMPPGSGTRIPL
jgi:hypothetical protein